MSCSLRRLPIACSRASAIHPGPRYATVVTEAYPGLLTMRPNGVKVITGRTVFHSLGAEQVTCPRCRHTTDLTGDGGHGRDAWRALSDTIGVWFDGGCGEHPCPRCRGLVGLNDWTWSPPWGFGYLGIDFWNWPRLSPQLLTEVSERLGHRTVHPYGKL